MKTSVLKPGLLVSLKTTVVGGVQYHRRELEQEHTTEHGARVTRWETERVIVDPVEFERATHARSRARAVVMDACCSSSFGLMCPNESSDKLEAAMEAAREIAYAHNRDAQLTRVDIYCITGRIAHDDVEAVRAIGAEVRELLDVMRAGIAAADPETIREAASKARELGGMLSEEVSGRVNDAIKEARAAARAIVKRVEKSGEEAAVVVAELSVKAIEAVRFSFLDMDAGAVEVELPAARAIDLETPPSLDLPGMAPATEGNERGAS